MVPDHPDFPPMNWTAPAAGPDLPAGEVHVWRVDLAPDPDRLAAARALLSGEELRRAERILAPDRGAGFVLTRGALRRLLGHYLGARPEAIVLGFSTHGKPFLDGAFRDTLVRFNVSHSGGRALLAFGLRRDLGVDIERIRSGIDLAGIARRFFTPGEAANVLGRPEPERPDAFFACWTRKEAYLKAVGKGIAAGVASVEIVADAGGRPQLRSPGGKPLPNWTIRDLDPGDGYRAALAVAGPPPQIRCWDHPDWS
jgi:4'-phosphopantetheinyl transferase